MIISLNSLILKYDLKIRGVLHIGAHYGEEYNDYVKHGIKNMVFFEPLKESFKILREKVPMHSPLGSNIRLFNVALGNETGTKEMFVETANNGQSSSLLEPGTHLTSYPRIKFDKRETVEIMKLDDVLFNMSDYNMINIDVQGYELEVFKGAIKTLEVIDYIYSEVNREDVYKGCAKVDELDQYLFHFRFERVETDWIGNSWGDALYIKK